MSHILRTSTEHITARAIMHIANLESHTALNTYNLWKLRGHLNTDDRIDEILIFMSLLENQIERKRERFPFLNWQTDKMF